VFLIDGSRSINARRFPLIRQLTEQIAQTLDIGLQQSLVGAIIFDSGARIHFDLLQHTDRAILLLAIAGLPYDLSTISQGTNTAGTLNLLLN